MTVFAAARGFTAHVERDWVPEQRALGIELQALPGGGSCFFAEATGYIARFGGAAESHSRCA